QVVLPQIPPPLPAAANPHLVALPRRPPLPPHFPYPTLCRPRGDVDLHHVGAGARAGVGDVDRHGDGTVTVTVDVTNTGSRTGAEDRKSTRVNSSHVANWYAVFCLDRKRQRAGLQAERSVQSG